MLCALSSSRPHWQPPYFCASVVFNAAHGKLRKMVCTAALPVGLEISQALSGLLAPPGLDMFTCQHAADCSLPAVIHVVPYRSMMPPQPLSPG